MGMHPDNVESCYGELNTIFTCLIGVDTLIILSSRLLTDGYTP